MQAIRTWWGQRFIAALERFTDTARLARGRGYASNDRIKSWKLEKGEMSAKIRGNVNPYFGVIKEPTYTTVIALTPISAEDWALLVRHLGSRAAFVSRLLLNEMPDNIEKPFELLDLHLLPHNARDFKTRCSCPDYANPCKHVAGLCYFLSAQLDQDPFLLFELRGLPRTELIERLRATPLGSALAASLDDVPPAPQPAESFFTRPVPLPLPDTVSPHAFWRGQRKLPAGVEPSAPAAVSGILIRKGGDFPPFWHKDESFVEVMDALYAQVRKKGKDWL
jgi:uncharacterized Zn finger protein